MIFLTVGTQFSFDRLVKSVDELISRNGLNEELFAQTGDSTYRPRNFEAVQFLDKHLFDKYLNKSSSIISHAGMGTITMAFEYDKPLLVMPRLAKFGEVVHDHQVSIARKFEDLGHILVAYDESELLEKIYQLKHFVPKPRKNQAQAVTDRIAAFLQSIANK